MTTELQPDQYPREEYTTQAPIGAAPASLAASIALGRLLRLAPLADLASIRFQIVEQSEHPYADPGPYVVCRAAEPDQCPSCRTIAGQHPHTEYCRRFGLSESRDYPGQPGEPWPGWISLDGVIQGSLAAPKPWLGHRDLCPIQWGEACDCDPVATAERHDQDQLDNIAEGQR